MVTVRLTIRSLSQLQWKEISHFQKNIYKLHLNCLILMEMS